MDDDALDVFAQCIEANVRQTQWATDRVMENKDEQIRTLSLALVVFYEDVLNATEAVTTRKLERALDRVAIQVANAERNLREEEF